MPLRESLTVEILADATRLESELGRAASLVDGLSGRLGSVGTAADAAARSVSSLGRAVGPVTKLSSTLARVAGQLRGIAKIPVTVNTAPAVASLAALSAQIARVSARLSSLNSASARAGSGGLAGGGGFGGGGFGSGGGAGPTGRVSRFATGGAVHGPAGVDRVPAMLTAGEFVLRASVARDLGRPLLEHLNAGLPWHRAGKATAPAGAQPPPPRSGDPAGVPTPQSSRVVVEAAAGEPVAAPTPPFGDRRDTRKPRRPVASGSPPATPTGPPATVAGRSDAPHPTSGEPDVATGRQPPPAPVSPPSPPSPPVFNEITVNVTHAVDLDELLRELQLGQSAALDRLA